MLHTIRSAKQNTSFRHISEKIIYKLCKRTAINPRGKSIANKAANNKRKPDAHRTKTYPQKHSSSAPASPRQASSPNALPFRPAGGSNRITIFLSH